MMKPQPTNSRDKTTMQAVEEENKLDDLIPYDRVLPDDESKRIQAE